MSFIETWRENSTYFEMLTAICKISKLFSDNSIPYIDYRIVENLFCRYYEAENDARLCTAFDARIGAIGIGIKTFILGSKQKREKVAEFNQMRAHLNKFEGIGLARELGRLRNERINFSLRTYNIRESIYHIVGREDQSLCIFNCDYPLIQTDQIGAVKTGNAGSISFSDGLHSYNFNNSKSVLMMQFCVPEKSECVVLDTPILEDPYTLLSFLLKGQTPQVTASPKKEIKGRDYIILPLYSVKRGFKYIPEKSGLNQWNAEGRHRDADEIYIPIPLKIHHLYPDFFPSKDQPFILHLPDGQDLSAKICQQGGKALMSNPNKALGKWLLRDILKLEERKLVTYDVLALYGIDSVIIRKKTKQPDSSGNSGLETTYSLQFGAGKYEDYDSFISDDI